MFSIAYKISLLLCATFFISPLLLSAQDKSDMGHNLTIRAMINGGNSRYKLSTETSPSHEISKTGWGFGLGYAKMFGDNFYIDISGEINSRGYKNGGAISSTLLGLTYKATYLDIPVSFNYISDYRSFILGDTKFVVGAGAYYGLALSGKYQTSTGWSKMKFGESGTDTRSATDYGILFNLGIKSKGLPLLVATYTSGLNDIIPSNNPQTVYEWKKLTCAKLYFLIPLGSGFER